MFGVTIYCRSKTNKVVEVTKKMKYDEMRDGSKPREPWKGFLVHLSSVSVIRSLKKSSYCRFLHSKN